MDDATAENKIPHVFTSFAVVESELKEAARRRGYPATMHPGRIALELVTAGVMTRETHNLYRETLGLRDAVMHRRAPELEEQVLRDYADKAADLARQIASETAVPS